MQPQTARRAIIVATNFTSLQLARCLGQAGIPTVVLAYRRRTAALRSRYAKGVLLPGAGSGKERRNAILFEKLWSMRHEGGVIFPSGDQCTAFLAEKREELAPYFSLAIAPGDVVLTIVDKKREIAALASSGIALPRSVTELPDQPEPLLDRLGLPMILKPRNSDHNPLGHKTVLVRTAADLDRIYSGTRAHLSSLVAQEYVPGDVSSLWICTCVFDGAHELVSAFVFTKVRTMPARDGVTAIAESRWNPELVELARRFGRSLGYVGIVDLEFKLDSRTGEYKYIEANPRAIKTAEFAARVGVNQVEQAYRIALGEKVRAEVLPHRDGVWYFYLYCVLQSCFLSGQTLGAGARELALDCWRVLWRRRVWGAASLSDPLPFLVELGVLAYGGLRLFRRMARACIPLRGLERDAAV